MSKKSKTIFTIVLLVLALIQGPYLYYFTAGFGKLFLLEAFSVVGLMLTFILFLQLLFYRSTTTLNHIFGLITAIIVGVSTSKYPVMENVDFILKMNERNNIITHVKKGTLKSTHIQNEFFPVSNEGNDIIAWKKPDSSVHVEFYIDRGFLDHASVFVYTDDPAEIRHLDARCKTAKTDRDTVVRKFADNWYREGY